MPYFIGNLDLILDCLPFLGEPEPSTPLPKLDGSGAVSIEPGLLMPPLCQTPSTLRITGNVGSVLGCGRPMKENPRIAQEALMAK